jgi:hypothetical protein
MLVGDAVEQLPELNSMAWPCLFTQQAWGYIPLAVHASLHTWRDEIGQLRDCVGTLELRLQQHATTSLQSVVHGVHNPRQSGRETRTLGPRQVHNLGKPPTATSQPKLSEGLMCRNGRSAIWNTTSVLACYLLLWG